jgi:hypothetical protein
MIERIETTPLPALATALADFERSFRYPLGPGRFFRISHGDDYHAFFRAIGTAACFFAVDDGVVIGSIAVVIRRLGLPDGGERAVAYVADLKVAAGPRAGQTLVRLSRSARSWAGERTDVAFAVVMDGTRATPATYSGRVGIPAFDAIGALMILRLAINGARVSSTDGVYHVHARAAETRYLELCRGHYSSPGGEPATRSLMPATRLVATDGMATGLLEDTRRAKRLWADHGDEMVSAHLSHFAYASVPAGAALLREALRRSAALRYPALFVAVPADDADRFVAELGGIECVRAPATVYGHGLPPGLLWNVNTAEI